MKSESALRKRFLRHDGIYRSDVSFLLINPVQPPPPVGRRRYRAIGRVGRITPCPSSAMSSGRLFLERVARQHCPSPLRRQDHHKAIDQRTKTKYHRTANHWFSGCLSLGVHPNPPHVWNPRAHRGPITSHCEAGMIRRRTNLKYHLKSPRGKHAPNIRTSTISGRFR